MTAVCECMFGLGGAATDTATGEPLLAQKFRALGVTVPPIYDYTDCAAVARAILALPKTTQVFLCAISCGANRIPWVIQAVRPRKITAAYMIAPSSLCNAGCPDVADNCDFLMVFNAPWWMSLPPGLSSYQPQPQAGNSHTVFDRRFVYDWHPCDFDVENVQNPIVADMKKRLSA